MESIKKKDLKIEIIVSNTWIYSKFIYAFKMRKTI